MQRALKTVETPKGKITGSNPIDGFQIIKLESFFANSNIPDSIKEKPHQLYFDLIWVSTKGKGTHFVDFEPYAFEEYSIFVIKNRQYHAWEVNRDRRGFLIFLSPEFYIKLGSGMSYTLFDDSSIPLMPPTFSLRSNKDIDAVSRLLALVSTEYFKEMADNKVLKAYVNALLSKLEYEYSEQHPLIRKRSRESLFHKFQTLLNNHIANSRNGLYYCHLLNTSYNSLNRQCKLHTGFTLKSYLDIEVIIRAKRRLLDPNLSISDVAYSLGFDEVGNFSKYFRKKTGKTPGAFSKDFS